MRTKVPRPIVVVWCVVVMACAAPLAAQQAVTRPRGAQQTTPRGSAPQAGRQAAGQAAPGALRTAQQPPPGIEPPGQAAIQGVAAAAPFGPLTPAQEQLLDQILLRWEQQSDRIKTFKCSFDRWEVNPTFVPKEFNHVLTEGKGYIKFKEPDHGIYRVTELREWDKSRGGYVPRTTALEHWVCNGKSIFEYNTEKKQLIERPLAPELQGKAIANGPLPFIFGAKAAQLKRRYWMRDVTPAAEVNHKIRLEAWPKFQQDKANFHHAIVILNQRDFIPEALRIILPDGKNTQDYAFTNRQVNDPLSILKVDFLPPFLPLGWQKVVERPQSAQPPGGPAQAQRAAAKERN